MKSLGTRKCHLVVELGPDLIIPSIHQAQGFGPNIRDNHLRRCVAIALALADLGLECFGS